MKYTDEKIKAYKVADHESKCRGMLIEVGKTYTAINPVRCGESGIHCCLKAIDCFNYYDFYPNNHVFEVEFWGEYDDDATADSKIAASNITILRELTWHEVLDIVNTGMGNTGRGNSGHSNSGNCNGGNCNSGNCNSGYRNSGHSNSGDRNSGDSNSGHSNSGDRNSGDRNSGNRNSGDRNSGYRNSGHSNSGDRNSGNCNSGNCNSGNCNSGHYNSCNCESGFFNSEEGYVRMFNKPTWLKRGQIDIPYIQLKLTEWVEYSDAEKAADENKGFIGGYLKTYTYKEAWANWDKTASEKERKAIKALPNYDADVFMEITGLDWRNK